MRLSTWHTWLVLLALVGCAQIQVNKESTSWEAGQDAIKSGISESNLTQCAGEPIRKIRTQTDEKWVYGVSKYMSFASAYCLLTISVQNGRTTGFIRQSANPGGINDYPQVCSYIVDRCTANGHLWDSASDYGNAVTLMHSEQEIPATLSYGNNAFLQGLTMATRQSVVPAAPVALSSTAQRQANQTSINNSGEKYSSPASECIKISAADTIPEGVSFNLVNTCRKRISVFHCFDKTQGLGGECNRRSAPGNGGSLGEWWGGHQGAGDLSPGASAKSIYIPSNAYIHIRACEIPAGKSWIMLSDQGDGGRYSCQIMQ